MLKWRCVHEHDVSATFALKSVTWYIIEIAKSWNNEIVKFCNTTDCNGNMLLQVSFTEYRLFCRSLLQNIVSFIGLFKFKGGDLEAFLVRVTSHVHVSEMTSYTYIYIYVYIYIYRYIYRYIYVYLYIYIHTYILHIHVYVIAVVGWLRLAGSSELYVSFAKEPCKRDDIL